MTWGTSLFLIAVGAVLKFAVTATTSGVDIQEIGVILMIVGAVGLVLSFVSLGIWRDRRVPVAGDEGAVPIERERVYYS